MARLNPGNLLLREAFGKLRGGIADVVPGSFHRDPDVALGLRPGIGVQRARADQHHARALLGAREQVAAAGLAERTELAGRGIVGHEIVRAGHDLEAAFLHGQDRGKRGAREFPAIRTMAVREDQDLARALVLHFPAIATACQHGGLLGFAESLPQDDGNAKGEGKEANHGLTRMDTDGEGRNSRLSRRRGGVGEGQVKFVFVVQIINDQNMKATSFLPPFFRPLPN